MLIEPMTYFMSVAGCFEHGNEPSDSIQECLYCILLCNIERNYRINTRVEGSVRAHFKVFFFI